MADVEIDVFNYVYQSVVSLVPTGGFKNEYVAAPSKFPFATLMEMDNYTNPDRRSSASTEDSAIVMYEANSYAMDKLACRSLMDAINTAMDKLGFLRISQRPTPNLEDPNVYRITARYRAEADANKTIYRHR